MVYNGFHFQSLQLFIDKYDTTLYTSRLVHFGILLIVEATIGAPRDRSSNSI